MEAAHRVEAVLTVLIAPSLIGSTMPVLSSHGIGSPTRMSKMLEPIEDEIAMSPCSHPSALQPALQAHSSTLLPNTQHTAAHSTLHTATTKHKSHSTITTPHDIANNQQRQNTQQHTAHSSTQQSTIVHGSTQQFTAAHSTATSNGKHAQHTARQFTSPIAAK